MNFPPIISETSHVIIHTLITIRYSNTHCAYLGNIRRKTNSAMPEDVLLKRVERHFHTEFQMTTLSRYIIYKYLH